MLNSGAPTGGREDYFGGFAAHVVSPLDPRLREILCGADALVKGLESELGVCHCNVLRLANADGSKFRGVELALRYAGEREHVAGHSRFVSSASSSIPASNAKAAPR